MPPSRVQPAPKGRVAWPMERRSWGVATTRSMERVATALGALEQAETRFERSDDVPHGGVLCALAALLSFGLLRATLKATSALPRAFIPLKSPMNTTSAGLHIRYLPDRFCLVGERGCCLSSSFCWQLGGCAGQPLEGGSVESSSGWVLLVHHRGGLLWAVMMSCQRLQ